MTEVQRGSRIASSRESRSFEAGRTCWECGIVLSIYNGGTLCGPHERAYSQGRIAKLRAPREFPGVDTQGAPENSSTATGDGAMGIVETARAATGDHFGGKRE